VKIVKAEGQYMYDENGRQYLDCINNVAHGKLKVRLFETMFSPQHKEQSVLFTTALLCRREGLFNWKSRRNLSSL